MSIQPGKYKARCTGEQDVQFGYAGTNSEQVALVFRITEGEHAGYETTWFGNFGSEDAITLTLKALRACGWQGDNITDLKGIDSQDVELVFVEEVSQQDGKTYVRAKYVNKPGGRVEMKKTMDAGARAAFAQKLRGKIVALGQKAGADVARPASRPANGGAAGGAAKPAPAWDGTGPSPDDDIPFLSSQPGPFGV